jgi:hypothetical protein
LLLILITFANSNPFKFGTKNNNSLNFASKELKKGFPNIGQQYKKNDVEGKVVSLNLLKKTVTIETKNKTLVEVEI